MNRVRLGVCALAVAMSLSGCSDTPGDAGSSTFTPTGDSLQPASLAADDSSEAFLTPSGTDVAPDLSSPSDSADSSSSGNPAGWAAGPGGLGRSVARPSALPPAQTLTDLASSVAEASQAARPTQIRISDIGVAGAEIYPVGVESDGTMTIPGATEVGWYQYSSRPGTEGASVLAAHIAYDGVDGVFRYLSEIEIGALVTVEMSDGTTQDWVVERLEQYNKTELPDELFADEGSPTLVLITCGGDFNPNLRSYDDNVVAIARMT